MGDLGYCIIIAVLILSIIFLILRLQKLQQQISGAEAVVAEIAAGNIDRRLITPENSKLASLCYMVNDIAIHAKAELIKNKRAELQYRRLATSLSHDIRTLLTSLTGYLEAIQLGIALEKEKEEYI